MAEQKKLRLEVAAMLDKKKILIKISGNNNFLVNVSEPFNSLSVEFLNDFSNALKNYKKISSYPDLIYLMFWTSKKKIKNLIKNLDSNEIRLGRGLIFHICPSNVPTNFIYSFFFGLLSGNSNVIKIPSKNFSEKEVILSLIKSLFKKKKYSSIKNSNCFIKYNNDSEVTEKISSICDARVIWGGDDTINKIRKIWIPERAIDITFSDRYSLSIINLNQLKKEKESNIQLLAKRFYYDGYTMNQLACNSPHFIIWVGKKNINLQNKFWDFLNIIVDKKFIFDDIHVVDKYSNLIENIILNKNINFKKKFKNNLYILEANKNVDEIENIRGVNGTFFEKNINNLNELKKLITKKCQTVTFYGFEKNELKSFLSNNNLLGIDRLVPIGKALDINIIWDGFDIVRSLSRIITVE